MVQSQMTEEQILEKVQYCKLQLLQHTRSSFHPDVQGQRRPTGGGFHELSPCLCFERRCSRGGDVRAESAECLEGSEGSGG